MAMAEATAVPTIQAMVMTGGTTVSAVVLAAVVLTIQVIVMAMAEATAVPTIQAIIIGVKTQVGILAQMNPLVMNLATDP